VADVEEEVGGAGRNGGATVTPSRRSHPGTVNLFRVSTAARVWHFVNSVPGSALALCGATPNESSDVPVELGIDEHVIAHRGRAVCSRCRSIHREREHAAAA
jgi:hypothetical protein